MGEEAALAVQTPTALVGALSGDPVQSVEKAKVIAASLKNIIRDQKLSMMIGDKEHVFVDGWTTMGAMLGIFPRTDWVRRVEFGDVYGWQARITLVHLASGKEVCSGEALCLSDEKRWGDAAEFSMASMAETRGTGKAFRIGFSWIMSLAGYASTPAEEMEFAKREQARAAVVETTRGEEWVTVDHKADEYKGIKGKNIELAKIGFRWKRNPENPDGPPMLQKLVKGGSGTAPGASPAQEKSEWAAGAQALTGEDLFFDIMERIAKAGDLETLAAAKPSKTEEGLMKQTYVVKLQAIYIEKEAELGGPA